MGLTHDQHAKRQAEIKALVGDQAADDTSQVEKQVVVTEDATLGNEERLRGIPAVGRVSGTMKGTRPGDTVRALMAEIDELYEQARIERGKVNRHLYKRPRG